MNSGRHSPVLAAALLTLAGALAVAAGFVGVPGVLESPVRLDAKASELKTQLVERRSDNNEAQALSTHLPEVRRQIETIQQQFAAMDQIIPEAPDNGGFLDTLRKDAKVTGVTLLDAAAAAPVRREFYTEEPFHVRLQGRYDALTAFFQRVDNEDRLVSVTELSMNAPGTGKWASAGPPADARWDADCTLTIYFSQP